MPQLYQHNINDDTRLAVWHITEPEAFFLQKVPLKKNVSHPHKRLQHLAGRYLLPFLFDDFPLSEIQIADTRKPFLENEQYHFSISHCGDYAAAIASTRERVGIDIELITDKIERVKHKFTTQQEQYFINGASPLLGPTANGQTGSGRAMLTMIWSAKESIFKWYAAGQLDFRLHMQLTDDVQVINGETALLPFLFTKTTPRVVNVCAKTLDNFVLAWLHT